MNTSNEIEAFLLNGKTNANLDHEINLLIDEMLALIQSSSPLLKAVYLSVFELWIRASKDSPLLLNILNRLTRSYTLLKTFEASFFNLVEACIGVYFEPGIDAGAAAKDWKLVCGQIEFKMGEYSVSGARLTKDPLIFELKCLEFSSYLLLNAYIIRRRELMETPRALHDYSMRIINCLAASYDFYVHSKPKSGEEEKV